MVYSAGKMRSEYGIGLQGAAPDFVSAAASGTLGGFGLGSIRKGAVDIHVDGEKGGYDIRLLLDGERRIRGIAAYLQSDAIEDGDGHNFLMNYDSLARAFGKARLFGGKRGFLVFAPPSGPFILTADGIGSSFYVAIVERSAISERALKDLSSRPPARE